MGSHVEKLKLFIEAEDNATPTIKSLTKTIAGIGAAYLGWRTVTSVIGDIINAAAESERAWNAVSASLQRHGYQSAESLKAAKEFSSELQRQTGLSDELVGEGIQQLLDYGGKLNNTYDNMRIAADLAAGAHMDLRAAVDLIGKASVGYTATLSRYGIILDETLPKEEKFQAALEQINQRFGGAAQAEMNTYAGQMRLLNEMFGDLKETIGIYFLPALLDVTKSLSGAIGTIIDITTAVGDFLTPTKELSDVIVREFEPGTYAYAKALEELNAAFRDGRISVEEYKTALDNLGVINIEKSAEQINQLTEQIINQSNQINDVNIRLARDYGDFVAAGTDDMIAGVRQMQDEMAAAAEESERILAELSYKIKSAAAIESRPMPIFTDSEAEIAELELIDAALDESWKKQHQAKLNYQIEHNEAIKKLEQLQFNNSLIGLNEYDAERRRIEENYRQMINDMEVNYILTTEERNQYIIELQKQKTAELNKLEKKANDEMIANTVNRTEQMAEGIASSMARSYSAFVLGRNKLKDVFRGMAMDFMQLFIEQILDDLKVYLIPKLIKLLALFDKRENDAMAVRIGRDYVRYMMAGMTTELEVQRPAAKIGPSFPINSSGGDGYGGMTVNYNFYGNVTDPNYVRDDLIPVIETESEKGTGRFVLAKRNRTGEPDGQFY